MALSMDSNKTITSTNTKTPLARFMPYFLLLHQMALISRVKTLNLMLYGSWLPSFHRFKFALYVWLTFSPQCLKSLHTSEFAYWDA